jgi:hypothetical protein
MTNTSSVARDMQWNDTLMTDATHIKMTREHGKITITFEGDF